MRNLEGIRVSGATCPQIPENVHKFVLVKSFRFELRLLKKNFPNPLVKKVFNQLSRDYRCPLFLFSFMFLYC